MAFHHSSTFLRSALARDPFCHGGIISAEDVIRIESKFPTLFDKPPSTYGDDSSEVAGEADDTFLTVSPVKVKSTFSKEKLSRCKPASTRLATGPVVKAKPAAVPAPLKSKYHRKCFTGGGDASEAETHRKPIEKSKPSFNSAEKARDTQRMLSKPSISLEDLREVLKQVLEEERGPKNSSRLGARSLPSPYTEDLVKKFFGKKLEEMKRQKLEAISKRKGESREPAIGRTRAKPTQAAKVTSGNNPSITKLSSNANRVGSSTSTPGFIRGLDELPRAPPPKLGTTYQLKRTCSGLDTSRSPRMDHAEGHVRQVTSLPEMSTSSKQQEEADESTDSLEITEDYISEADFPTPRARVVDMEKPGIVRDTRVIHLTCPKHIARPEIPSTRHVLRHPLPKSSYNQLLAAHQATNSRLETKAMLRKQELFDMKMSVKQMERMKHPYHGDASDDEDTPTQIVNRYRNQIERKTSNTLEKIAGELVYTEILHQLSEIRMEQEMRQKLQGGPPCTKVQSDHSQVAPSASEKNEKSEKVPPNPTLAAITETEDESQNESGARGAVIRTPEDVPTTHGKKVTSGSEKKVILEKALPKVIPFQMPAIEMEGESGDETGASISDAVLRTPTITPRMTNDRKIPSTPDSEHEEKVEKNPSRVIPTTTTVDPIEEEDSNLDETGGPLIKTPGLGVKPTSSKDSIVEKTKPSDDTDESISLQSSQLSPKNNKVETIPPRLQPSKTESPEMSYFTPSQPLPSNEDSEEEQEVVSVKAIENLQSPHSPPESIHDDIPHPPELKDNVPEKDESTMSGISTFSDSHRQLEADAVVNDEEDGTIEEDKVASKYSDDFIPEVASNCDSATFSVTLNPPANNPPRSSRTSMKHGMLDTDSENEDVLENLNTSRETVIDLLSEGEFVGEVVKSPGELSIRHHLQEPAEKLVFPKRLLSEDITSLKSKTSTSTLTQHEDSKGEVGNAEDENLGEYEISYISEGIQLAADERSWGKSIGEL